MKTYSREQALELMKKGAKMRITHWQTKRLNDYLSFEKGEVYYTCKLQSAHKVSKSFFDYSDGFYIINEGEIDMKTEGMTSKQAVEMCKKGFKVAHPSWHTAGEHMYWDGKDVRFTDCRGYDAVADGVLNRSAQYYVLEEDLRAILKTGMLVTYRNGEKALVMRDTFESDKLINVKDGCYILIKDYKPTLKEGSFASSFDIMKVEKPKSLTDMWRQFAGENKFYNSAMELTWQRNDEEAEKLKKVIAKLEADLQEAQEKLKELEQ